MCEHYFSITRQTIIMRRYTVQFNATVEEASVSSNTMGSVFVFFSFFRLLLVCKSDPFLMMTPHSTLPLPTRVGVQEFSGCRLPRHLHAEHLGHMADVLWETAAPWDHLPQAELNTEQAVCGQTHRSRTGESSTLWFYSCVATVR